MLVNEVEAEFKEDDTCIEVMYTHVQEVLEYILISSTYIFEN